MDKQIISKQTQKNWWIDATLFSSAIIVALSGISFLMLPSGGFHGGRNPMYNVQILFTRKTWGDLHIWSGIAMIAVTIVHLAIHWPCVTSIIRRTWNELSGKGGCMKNPQGRWNLILNITLVISFALTATSGVYFLFVPGGRGAVVNLTVLFTRATWNLIHTWAGVTFITASSIHFTIHWKWVTKVTRKMIEMFISARSTQQSPSNTTM